MLQKCLICASENLESWEVTAKPPRDYFRCHRCDFIFMASTQAHLPPEEERSRYEEHNNTESPGYRQMYEELRQYLRREQEPSPKVMGLDFGCGPTQYLVRLLNGEDGYHVNAYDPYFFPNTDVLTKNTYDFIVSTEVFEHFYEPQKEFAEIVSMLKSGGLLLVLTYKPSLNMDEFSKWHYRRDVTHVSFFSLKAFEFLCAQHGLKLEFFNQKNFWVMRKL